ncbi:MAG: cbb3-type cytochrome oxidase subunit 3 [Steroidobacteraceae bacterium]
MNLVRGILTLILMLSFITLVVWLYSKRNKHAYDDAARLPLEEDELSGNQHGSGSKQS